MRIDITSVAPHALTKVFALSRYIDDESGIDPNLALLIQLRASQINGCAFCMHMHTLQLQELGESQIRIDCLSAWDETDLFNDREKAALAWTESLTLISESRAPDEVYERLKSQFNDREIANLSLAIATINVWNRLAIGLRQDPRQAPAAITQVNASKKAAAMMV